MRSNYGNTRIEHIRQLWLRSYCGYCTLLYPLYKRVTVGTLDLTVSGPDIMAPLSSSENLLFGDMRGKTILDIGTGCGLVALVAKKLGAKYVLGVDINQAAISNAKENLSNNFLDCNNVEFRVGDVYQNVTQRFDIIVSNPPYFKDTPTSSQQYKYCGADILERILRFGKDYLNPNGEIRLLHPASSSRSLQGLADRFGYVVSSVAHVHSKDHRFLRMLLGQTIRPRLNIFVFKMH